MTAAAENVSGRTQPRYTGPVVGHVVSYEPQPDGTEIVRCAYCGVVTRLEGGHTDAQKARLERMHEGTEDPS